MGYRPGKKPHRLSIHDPPFVQETFITRFELPQEVNKLVKTATKKSKWHYNYCNNKWLVRDFQGNVK